MKFNAVTEKDLKLKMLDFEYLVQDVAIDVFMIDGITFSFCLLKHNYEAFLIDILKRSKTVIFSSILP